MYMYTFSADMYILRTSFGFFQTDILFCMFQLYARK